MSTQQPACKPGSSRCFAGKYFTFTLQHEAYGIDVLKVREIIRNPTITAVPQVPAYILGVINLRGKIIPVMDLRRRLGFSWATGLDQTSIIVVQVTMRNGKATLMGLVVDGVEEVIQLAATDIEATPEFGGQSCASYIPAIAKVKGTVKSLLDIDGLVGTNSSPNMINPASQTK